ncbi:MAG: hypothetical protein UZ11_BCD004000151 [Bacteroidetes bacterium OLB11]|nr:MAG: hypothetical protein UZ11_BCD004000151 [Bacteroidetes bacterium OLB11]
MIRHTLCSIKIAESIRVKSDILYYLKAFFRISVLILVKNLNP